MRELKFVIRNALNYSSVQQRVEELCTLYNVKDYSIEPYIDDQLALIAQANGKRFTVYLDYDTCELKICTSGEIIRIFKNDVCWDYAIEYLSKQ